MIVAPMTADILRQATICGDLLSLILVTELIGRSFQVGKHDLMIQLLLSFTQSISFQECLAGKKDN
jgi:hypothetical protein